MTVKGIIAWLIFLPAIVVTLALVTSWTEDVLDVAWLVAFLIAINFTALVFYAYDKIIAVVLGLLTLLRIIPLRVPETLLIWALAFPGGIVGTMLAMFALRHKTGPGSADFRLRLLGAVALEAALLIGLFMAVMAWDVNPVLVLDPLIAGFVGAVKAGTMLFVEQAGL